MYDLIFTTTEVARDYMMPFSLFARYTMAIVTLLKPKSTICFAKRKKSIRVRTTSAVLRDQNANTLLSIPPDALPTVIFA